MTYPHMSLWVPPPVAYTPFSMAYPTYTYLPAPQVTQWPVLWWSGPLPPVAVVTPSESTGTPAGVKKPDDDLYNRLTSTRNYAA